MKEALVFYLIIAICGVCLLGGHKLGERDEQRNSARKIAAIKSGFYRLEAVATGAPLILEQVTPKGERVVNSMAYEPCRAHDGVSTGEIFILNFQEPSSGEDYTNPDCYLQIKKRDQQQ